MVLPVPYARRMTEDRPVVTIPEHGRAPDELLAEVEAMHAEDIDWRGGRAFSLVYNPGDDDLEHVLEEVARAYLHDNALNPFKYPSLLRMEQEIISMACGLLGAPPRAGAVTSGGTESIFSAVQVARDEARSRGVAEPQLLTPSTAHPAFAKAAKYLDVEQVLVPVGDDGRADVAATVDAIGERTGLVVGSAPCYPYGVIDPITELAAAAAERGRAVPHRRLPRRLAAAVVGAARPAGRAVGLPGPGRHVDLGRHPQVRLHVQGRVDRRLPLPGPARAPVLLVRRLARRPVRVGHRRRAPARRRRSPARGPRSTSSAPTATCAWPARSSRPPRASGPASTRSTGVTITGAPDMSVMELTTDPASDSPSTSAASAT